MSSLESRVKYHKDDMPEWFERCYPWIFCWGGGVAILVARYFLKVPVEARLAVLNSLISAAAVMFGFIGTVMAILATFIHHEVFETLAKEGYSSILFKYLLSPLFSLSAVIIISLLITCFYWKNWWFDTISLFLLGTSIAFTVLSIIRLLMPIKHLMKKLNPQNEPPKIRPMI